MAEVDQELFVKKEITVKVPQDFAFNTYVDDMSKWWPGAHHIGKTVPMEVVIEKKAGGRWYERGADGIECDWGKLLAYEPYSRLLLQWQLDSDFVYSPNLYTEVEVLFERVGQEETKLTLYHRKLENFGATAEKMRNMLDQDNAWMDGLKHYAAYVETAAK